MAYTSTNEVAAEIGGVTISSTSTPTKAQVETWIGQADQEIDEVTGRVWGVKVVTSGAYEYDDYDGTGRIRFGNKPVISVQEISYESEGLGVSGTSWSTLSEGRTSSEDYILYKEEGVAQLHANTNGKNPKVGLQNLRKAYTYGYTITPKTIKRLSALLVAKRFILSVANKTGTDEGGTVSVGTITVSDPNNYVFNHISRVNEEINSLYDTVINKFKSYMYNNQLFD